MTISLEQLVAFNEEISAMVRGRMPLEIGLAELGKESRGALKQTTEALAERMRNGASLEDAIDAEDRNLPASYKTLVKAGIRAGRLPAALEAVSNYARELAELRNQTSLALLYPLIVVLMAYALFVVFVSHAVDRFRETYEVFFIRVPWFLRKLSEIGGWIVEYWWAFPLALLGVVFWWVIGGGARELSFRGMSQPLGWIPFVGSICRLYRRANFAELLSLMIEHDVPLPDGLRLSARSIDDPSIIQAAEAMAKKIEQGGAPRDIRRRSSGFPPFLYWALTSAPSEKELVRLLRHSAVMSRRRAINSSRWFRSFFPVAAAVIIGGGAVVLYVVVLFGPLAQFWNDLAIK